MRTTAMAFLVLIGVAPTSLAQRRPPDSGCRKWSQAAAADAAVWIKLAECGAVGGQALAAVLRREAARADTIRLGALERALLQIQDSAVFRAALETALDSAATPEARIVGLLVALGQFDPAVVKRRSSGFVTILADTTDTRCHLDLDRKRPGFRSVTRLPAVAPWLIATAAGHLAADVAPPAVRLFARCVRLAINDGLVEPPAALVGTVRDTSGRPIANADVVAMAGNTLARTSPAGTFLLGNLASGPEVLLIRAIGFTPQRFPATLTAGDTVPVAVVLGPAPQHSRNSPSPPTAPSTPGDLRGSGNGCSRPRRRAPPSSVRRNSRTGPSSTSPASSGAPGCW